MTDYTYVSGFGAKDALDSGESNKVIKGADFETEFLAIQGAINSKADTATPTFTGTVTIATTLSIGDWIIKVDTNELVFEYDSTEVFKVGTNGAITSADNVVLKH